MSTTYHTSRTGGGHMGGMAYYTEAAGEPPGRWAGKGVAKLGLAGEVDPGVIKRLFHEDIGPGGERLDTRKRGNYQVPDVTAAVAAYLAGHPFASGVELAQVRSAERSKNKNQRPYFDFALGAAKVGIADMSGSRLAEHRREGWQILAAFQVTAKAAIAIETDVLSWWRGELGLPSFLRRDQMPQGGWTETVAAGRVDLAATVTRICNLAVPDHSHQERRREHDRTRALPRG